ncbi:TonB-dependent receptor [Chakrabartia godavariana]|nr:TonB-dependent receptor [Chakrabartia godavariana]
MTGVIEVTTRTGRSRASAIALLLTTALATTPAFAADAASDAESAESSAEVPRELIVTGKRIEATQLAAEAIEFGNNVQVVSAQEIESTGATNFAELAQFLIKGANVGYSPDEGEYTIRLDGGGDRDTLVVLDGVPLYDRGPALEDIWGTTTIDPHMIERVEVFRGGNSLFFGSNGGIGVISIVTKRPDGTSKIELGAQYGSFNTREIWGNARFPLDAEGRHSVMFYGGTIQTDGPRIYAPESFVDNVAAAGGIQKYPLNRSNVGLKYLWKVDDKSEFRLGAQYTQIEFQDAFPNVETYSPNRVRYPIIDLSLDRKWSDSAYTEFAAYWNNPLLNNTETFAEICKIRTGCPQPSNPAILTPFGSATGKSIPFPNKGFGKDSKVGGYQEMGLNLRNTINFGQALEVVGGIQIVNYRDDSDPVFPIGDKSTTVTGLYADFRPTLPFSPDTKISLAARQDFSARFKARTIWKFGLRQPIGDFYVRANGGTSYSLPKVNELNAQSETLIGNPNLKTETTETYNVAGGFSKEMGNVTLAAEVGYFRTDIQNRIQTTSGLRPNTYFNNTATTQIRGLTANIDFNIGKTITTSLSFTKQKAHLKGSTLQINETPEYMLQGTLAYHSPDQRIHLTLYPRYQGPEYATGGVNNSLRTNFGNYFLLNGSLAYWAGESRQHKIQLRFVNILDEHYAERYGFANMFYSSAYNRGEIVLNSPQYFYGYEFEGKPRSVFVSFQTSF